MRQIAHAFILRIAQCGVEVLRGAAVVEVVMNPAAMKMGERKGAVDVQGALIVHLRRFEQSPDVIRHAIADHVREPVLPVSVARIS